MDVLVWNMAHDLENWHLLANGHDLAADIQLLCEAPRPPGPAEAIGRWRTDGLEVDLPLDQPVKREWSTAVVSPHGVKWITDARADRHYKELLPFKPSRPGTWTAGRVDIDGISIAAVAVYGLLDERSDASMHRSISELSSLFEHPEYGEHLLLGGDFNIIANPRQADPTRDIHLAFLQRLRAHGLVSCLEVAKLPERERMTNCPCGDSECRHQRTWRKHKGDDASTIQEDYLFASPKLAKKLVSCEAVFKDSSDHAAIRATFDF